MAESKVHSKSVMEATGWIIYPLNIGGHLYQMAGQRRSP